MHFIDLSHIISDSMPYYPGTLPPVIEVGSSIERDGFLEKKITMFSHTGTHMDAPAHLFKKGKKLDQFPIDHFTGSACVLGFQGMQRPFISEKDLLPHLERLQGCDFILLETGWSRFWETPAYFNDYPVLTPEAAHLLADCRPKGIGLDTISVDGIQEPGLPNHKIFLGQDTVIIENLTRLDRLPQEPFQFYCFPLKFKDSDGSPIRAVAVFNS